MQQPERRLRKQEPERPSEGSTGRTQTRLDKQREAEFQSARADKQALLRKAQADLKAEQARGDRLQKQFSTTKCIKREAAELDQATGTLVKCSVCYVKHLLKLTAVSRNRKYTIPWPWSGC